MKATVEQTITITLTIDEYCALNNALVNMRQTNALDVPKPLQELQKLLSGVVDGNVRH